MDDEDVQYLKDCFDGGITLLLRSDVACHEPGSLTKWHTCYRVVTGFGIREDEEVAYFDDGTYAALLACELSEWLITVTPIRTAKGLQWKPPL